MEKIKIIKLKKKENVALTYNGVLFSLKKEGNPAVWDNMDEPGGHYAK